MSVSVYTAPHTQLLLLHNSSSPFHLQELYDGLLDFLNERGINEEFPKEVLEFHRVFEHHCYVNDFLGGIKDFCTSN